MRRLDRHHLPRWNCCHSVSAAFKLSFKIELPLEKEDTQHVLFATCFSSVCLVLCLACVALLVVAGFVLPVVGVVACCLPFAYCLLRVAKMGRPISRVQMPMRCMRLSDHHFHSLQPSRASYLTALLPPQLHKRQDPRRRPASKS